MNEHDKFPSQPNEEAGNHEAFQLDLDVDMNENPLLAATLMHSQTQGDILSQVSAMQEGAGGPTRDEAGVILNQQLNELYTQTKNVFEAFAGSDEDIEDAARMFTTFYISEQEQRLAHLVQTTNQNPYKSYEDENFFEATKATMHMYRGLSEEGNYEDSLKKMYWMEIMTNFQAFAEQLPPNLEELRIQAEREVAAQELKAKLRRREQLEDGARSAAKAVLTGLVIGTTIRFLNKPR